VDGYVAVTDAPFTGVVPELIKIYPDAKVIVPMRDVEAREKSMVTVTNAATLWFLKFALSPLPSLRYFVDYIDVLRDVWLNLYGETEPPTRVTHKRHMELLKKTVLEDRLFFVSVKDGWERFVRPWIRGTLRSIPEYQQRRGYRCICKEACRARPYAMGVNSVWFCCCGWCYFCAMEERWAVFYVALFVILNHLDNHVNT
jgi:hypothetical protein